MEHLERKANHEQIKQALSAFGAREVAFDVCSEFDKSALSQPELTYYASIKSQRRGRQFAMGRMAARSAISKVAEPLKSEPLLRLDSGSVAWPAGLTGSISHCEEYAIAAVCKTSSYRSLGVDIEFLREVRPSTVSRIAALEELRLLADLFLSDSQTFFAIFSAKESIFKALSPLVNKRFGFSAAFLLSAKQNHRAIWELEFIITEDLSSEYCAGYKLQVHLYLADSFALTFCALPGL